MRTDRVDVTPAKERTGTSFRSWQARLRGLNQAGLVVALVVVSALFAIFTDGFLSVLNLVNLSRQMVTIALISSGMTLAIVVGGIDLSVGSVMSLASVVTALAVKGTASVVLGVAAGLAVGALAGAANGSMIAYLRVQPFITTIGMSSVASGVALVISDGSAVRNLPDRFNVIGTGYILGVPIPAVIATVVLAGIWFLLHRSPFGRQALATGGGEQAAFLSGTSTRRIKIMAFMLSGFLAAVAAVIATARTASGHPTLGVSVPLQAIAASVIGGASLGGGRGNILGTVVGVAFMTVLYNGMNLAGISIYTQDVLVGGVILAAAWLDHMQRKRGG